MRKFWSLVLGVGLMTFALGCGKEEKVTIPDKTPPPPSGPPVSGGGAPAGQSTGAAVK